MTFNIWEGIYKDFSQCSVSGPGHEGQTWVCRERSRIEELLSTAQKEKTVSDAVAYGETLLPVLVALTAGMVEDRKVSVLDFGGGLGFAYVPVVYGCVNVEVEFHIVESESICRCGKEVFDGDHRIHFHSSLPTEISEMDIVHLGSSLQYIQDWKGLLTNMAEFSPWYILLTDLPAGEIPTYATVQNYYDSKIPYWFFNINDIIDMVLSTGYELQFKSGYKGKRLGKDQPLPQDNFPEEYRLGDTCNLLFSRKK